MSDENYRNTILYNEIRCVYIHSFTVFSTSIGRKFQNEQKITNITRLGRGGNVYGIYLFIIINNNRKPLRFDNLKYNGKRYRFDVHVYDEYYCITKIR